MTNKMIIKTIKPSLIRITHHINCHQIVIWENKYNIHKYIYLYTAIQYMVYILHNIL